MSGIDHLPGLKLPDAIVATAALGTVEKTVTNTVAKTVRKTAQEPAQETTQESTKETLIPVDAVLCIVDAPCDVERTEQPFGQRWGQQVITLGPEHLAALQSGKLVAVDVQGEYVVFVKLGVGA